MWWSLYPRRKRSLKRTRRLGAEVLEDRSLLTSVPTPAAIEAESVAEAMQASSAPASSSPSVTAPTSAASSSAAGQTAANQNFITDVYGELLGRSPQPSEVQFWQSYLDQAVLNNLATTGATGSQGVGNAVSGAPVGGYALTEAPTSTPDTAVAETGPISGTGVAIGEYDYGNDTFASEGYPNGVGSFTTDTNGSVAPSSTTGVANTSSLAESESLYQAEAMSQGQSAAASAAGTQFVQDVLSSPEYRDRVVTQIFQDFLHRAPAAADTGYWGQQVGSVGERAVLADVLASQEYLQDAGRTGAGYIRALYRDVLGRSPSAADEQYWLSHLAAGGGAEQARAMVASAILSSPEASNLWINNPTHSALANLTGGGFNNQLSQGGLGAAEQQVYADALGGSTAFENVIESMVADNQYYQLGSGPGAGENPAQTTSGPI